jgi:hypothetical protein
MGADPTNDTHPKIEAFLLEGYRKMSVSQKLEFRYVGGSVAGSVYGIPRATQDVDPVADIRIAHVDALTSALVGSWRTGGKGRA